MSSVAQDGRRRMRARARRRPCGATGAECGSAAPLPYEAVVVETAHNDIHTCNAATAAPWQVVRNGMEAVCAVRRVGMALQA